MNKIVRGTTQASKVFPKVKIDLEVTTYEGCNPNWIPEIDDTYWFDREALEALLVSLEMGDNVLIVGHTGCGKTSLVAQAAARLGYELYRVNFDSNITRADIIGEWVVKGKEMNFQYGIVPKAMQRPAILLLDEWDAISSDVAFVFQRILEDKKLMILEKGGELIEATEGFRIVATANTTGMGDDTGLYHGTRLQNYSQIDRFETLIKMRYLPKREETNMLNAIYPMLAERKLIDPFVKVANTIREAFSTGEVSAPLSTRQVRNWISKYILFLNPVKAAKLAFLNKLTHSDEQAIIGMMQRAELTNEQDAVLAEIYAEKGGNS